MSLIHCAAQTHRADLVRLCIKEAMDVNNRDYSGCTPICLACRYEDPEIVAILVNARSNFDIPDVKGRSPIFEAASNANPDIVRILVKSGCMTQADFLPDKTPLYGAVHAENKTVDRIKTIVEMLLDAGYNPNREKWLRDKQIPDRLARDGEFCSWLVSISRSPVSLQQTCQIVIRKLIGRNLNKVVYELPLPYLLRRFVSLEDL